jgi:hypothetical protein
MLTMRRLLWDTFRPSAIIEDIKWQNRQSAFEVEAANIVYGGQLAREMYLDRKMHNVISVGIAVICAGCAIAIIVGIFISIFR